MSLAIMTNPQRALRRPRHGRPALWGGVECTIARLGDSYRDQLHETGHFDRIEDLDAIADTGITTLRYPVLWESVSPDAPDRQDWSWHDARLSRLRALGITPIVGLIHHGSGPRYTDLLDPHFAAGLARHAGAVARRYPWVMQFVPVNEPLTTARFSGLYGHWYPHRRDDAAFVRMLVHQCQAIALSMRAIRRVTPGAQLVQTEDFGKVFATPALADQALFENHRRWLTWDLLCGRVDGHHPLHAYLTGHGIAAEELQRFVDDPTPPDILGVNHYLTSERFLDDDLDRYAPDFHGGNGRLAYADVEAVRIPALETAVGPLARLREIWQRYRRPMAVTEAHHGNTPDQQVRWLLDVWAAAEALAAEGADIHAVTIWSMMGVVDWNSLLVRRDDVYEPGAFDVRHSPPRLTAVGAAVRDLARNASYSGDDAAPTGWWRQPSRFFG